MSLIFTLKSKNVFFDGKKREKQKGMNYYEIINA